MMRPSHIAAYIIGIVMGILISSVVKADHDPIACMERSNTAFLMADARDSKIPKAYFTGRLERIPKSQRAEYKIMIESVYGSPDVFPERMGAIFAHACMGHD